MTTEDPDGQGIDTVDAAHQKGAKPSTDTPNKAGRPKSGRAPEYHGGQTTESGFLDAALDYLGGDYIEVSPGRFVSSDGTRQVRFGAHETRGPQLHAHFEAVEEGRVTENTRVDITPDKSPPTASPDGRPETE